MPGNLKISAGLIKAIVIIFVASACSMVLELVAGRILAPYIGVSLYTWTSIIGVILAGISLGNYLGGKAGDKFDSPLVLSIIFFAASIFSLTILPVTGFLRGTPLPSEFPLMSRTTIYCFALFFLPATFLGMVTPIVIKQTLKDLGNTGNVVGTIYAISCAGSILGTFLTGFFLIDWFGTRLIIWQVAGILFFMATFSTNLWTNKLKLSLAAGTLIVFAVIFFYRDSFQMNFIKESNYYAINIYDTHEKGRPVKALVLDHLVHSFVDVSDPRFHGYEYEATFAAVTTYSARGKSDIKTLSIGGGGYSFPRYLEITYPGASIEVVEIDPAVTRVAYSELGVRADTRIVTHNMDARLFFIQGKINQKYNLVFGDAFNDKSVPYHLTTFEFNEHVKNALKTDGFYVVNLIDKLKDGQFARSFMKTLSKSFKSVYLFLPGTDWKSTWSSTYVIMATNGDFAPSGLMDIVNANIEEYGRGQLVTLAEIEENLGTGNALVLTDDHNPVDNMLAPLFDTR